VADFLIKHLKKKAEEHSSLEMLVNQWGFDEKLIPKALQTIGNLFPHYSRHDESHSRQILVNIERLLGKKNIEKLTATDTWLLLEAAYWHDIGMVVPQKDIEEALNHPGFSQYIQEICNNPLHELHQFSVNFSFSDMSQCFSGADTPIEAMDKFRQLMAEWFRQQHATRAKAIVQDPWENAGISSPRTELIPTRLFKLLGRVCHMHGLPFKSLLCLNGLPYREAGLAQEDCHPRFVACLLRMGDLLDLDDNRFCPVMQCIAGENRSSLSKSHEDKHAGIYHLRIDRERIEITAECKTIDGYLETFKWFDWLKQEMQDQMTHWRDIVPSREFGLLPTLGDIEVRLSGELQILKEGRRPQFSIDGKQAIKLLQGNNLYSSHFACIRELLQNAVDATLLHLWLVNEKSEAKLTWDNPYSERAKKVLQSKKIEVILVEKPRDSSIPNDKTPWALKVVDQGTGISRDDLSYMLCIRGSQRNLFRKEKILSMPEWMKPSGDFGIGFQSVFLICDVVKLTTKCIFTNEIFEITMHNPTGDKEGLVLLRLLESDISYPYGTTIEIDLLFEKISRSWSMSLGDRTSFKAQFLNSYDPVLDESLPLEAMQLGDEIQKFVKNSCLPIYGELSTVEKTISFPLGMNNGVSSGDMESWSFIELNGYQIALQYEPTVLVLPARIDTLYRGQSFEQKVLYLPNVNIVIDLLSGKAGHWLTANREKLVATAEDEFKSAVLAVLFKQVSEDLKSISSEKKPVYSFFLEAMALHYGGEWCDLASRVEKSWLGLSCQENETYKNLFENDEWVFGIKPHNNEFQVSGCNLLVSSSGYTSHIIVKEWLKGDQNTVQIIGAENDMDASSTLRYRLKNKDQPLYSKPALAVGLANATSSFQANERFLLNFEDGWGDLKLNDLYLKGDVKIRASYLFNIPQRVSKTILLPFLFCDSFGRTKPSVQVTSEQLGALCKWVQPRLENGATISDIRSAYDRLIEFIDNDIMRPSPYWKSWGKARGLN